MCLGVRPGVDVPHSSYIAPSWSPDGGRVVAVMLTLAEEKNILVATRWPVLHTFRLAIRLVPYDVGAKIPALLLQGEGEQPGDANQILRLQALRRGGTDIHGPYWILFISGPPRTAPRCVRIADIEPEGAIIPEYPAHL